MEFLSFLLKMVKKLEGMFCKKGFSLVELVITVTILAILAAVAIPIFQDLQGQARNATTQGGLGVIRTAISNYRANEIAHDRADGFNVTGWPDLNKVTDVHCTAVIGPHVMQNSDTPDNPWARVAGYGSNSDCVQNAAGNPKGTLITGAVNAGWNYNPTNGEFWANTAQNGGAVTENQF